MAKFNLLKVLKSLQVAIDLLEASGVNVDKLVHISNTQGPQARKIQSTIDLLVESVSDRIPDSKVPDLSSGSPFESRPMPPKRLKTKTNP